MDYVANHTLFSKLNPKEKKEILSFCEKVEFPSKRYLYKEGRENAGVYFIKEGFAKIYLNKPEGRFVLWFAKEGDIVGIDSLFNNSLNKDSCVAVQDVTAYFLHRKKMLECIEKGSGTALEVLKYLVEKVDVIEDRIYNMNRKNVSFHFAELLQMFSSRRNIPIIPNILNVQEIANAIGTTRNYVYRLIQIFEEKNILSFKDRRLRIINGELLRRYCMLGQEG